MPIPTLDRSNPMVKAVEEILKRDADALEPGANKAIPAWMLKNHYEVAPLEMHPNTLMQLRGMHLPPYAHDQESDLPPDPDDAMITSTYEMARRGAKKLDGPSDEELLNAIALGLGQEM